MSVLPVWVKDSPFPHPGLIFGQHFVPSLELCGQLLPGHLDDLPRLQPLGLIGEVPQRGVLRHLHITKLHDRSSGSLSLSTS